MQPKHLCLAALALVACASPDYGAVYAADSAPDTASPPRWR